MTATTATDYEELSELPAIEQPTPAPTPLSEMQERLRARAVYALQYAGEGDSIETRAVATAARDLLPSALRVARAEACSRASYTRTDASYDAYIRAALALRECLIAIVAEGC